ncbi:MAG: hypothetical protein A3K12_03725 [Candidatus Rokubacteria bacterium RIFCSPLOWO2_12_FULL_71_19]|nr:MAG: hypothetical protein A3K12_03725 [Candidatus Rokubacteria bacterium RIFCSPLOWO2_12_FULL_71_19]
MSLRAAPVLLAVLLWSGTVAADEAAKPGAAGPPEIARELAPDPAQAELLRARLLARLGRTQEALAAFRALLAQTGDRALREEYAEALADFGLLRESLGEASDLLAQEPGSVRMRRLRARLHLLGGEPGAAAALLEALAREEPGDAWLAADLADAEHRSGRWRRALSLYAGLAERDPDNDALRRAYREILLAHASRLELSHATLFQLAATHHTEEVAWKGWLGDRVWLRAGARHAIYTQDAIPGLPGFTEEVQTGLLLAGYRIGPRLALRAGLEEARRRDTVRTTLRLGGSFDDQRATTVSLDVAVRELLTNPVVAIPLRGTTDPVTADLYHRLVERLTLGAHYEHRSYRVSGERLGRVWDLGARADTELLRGPVQVILSPQLFLSEYSPAVGSPLRERVSFVRRQDVAAIGLLVGIDLLPRVRLQAGSIGRRDLHRAITSWEVTGDGRWRIHPRVDLRVLYTRNTEGGAVGGKEESVSGVLTFLH